MMSPFRPGASPSSVLAATLVLAAGAAPFHARPADANGRSGPTGRLAAAAPAPPSRAAAALATVADPCSSLNASSLGGYRNLIGKALSAARVDADRNGTSGAYAVAATNARDQLQRAYDRASQMVDFNQNHGNRNPNSTTYAEGGQFKAYLQSILNMLPDAAHWATISAVYHRSRPAMDAFSRTMDALSQGSALMSAAGLCYTAPYMAGTVKAG